MPARVQQLPGFAVLWVACLLVSSMPGCAPGSVQAQTSSPANTARAGASAEHRRVWRPEVKSVAVFKNGLGFFTREAEVGLHDGWCTADAVPPAAFGTLALYSLSEQHLVDIIGSGQGEMVSFDDRDAPATDAERTRRLNACVGLKVQLTYRQPRTDNEATAAGKLISVAPDFAILEAEGTHAAVPLPQLTRLQVLELPLRIHVQGPPVADDAKIKLGMAYLRKGIVWIPEYTLKILDDQTAELTLRGTLINEAEDLIHTDVHFVVGVPHFTHTDYLAPVAIGQVIRTLGAALAPIGIMSQVMNQALITSNGFTSDPQGTGPVHEQPVDAGGDVAGLMGNLPAMEGGAQSDYTVYTKQDLTIRRGERAIVTLFTQRISYGHIYRWNLPAAMEHALVLKNATPTAWTTGPCLAMSDGHPLTEDLLRYTPKGGSVELPVTAAINIAQQQRETELDRKLKAHSPAHEVFLDLVTLKGTLTVQSFEPQPVDLRIRLAVPGRPTEASDAGNLNVDTSMLKLTERRGSIEWTLTLQPNERKQLTYQYERYVPSN